MLIYNTTQPISYKYTKKGKLHAIQSSGAIERRHKQQQQQQSSVPSAALSDFNKTFLNKIGLKLKASN